MSAAEAVSSAAYSASCYDTIENIRVLPIVEPEGKLVEVKWQILCRHLVIVADDASFQKRPERFNRLSVDVAAHVLILAVVNFLVRQVFAQMAIMMGLIGRNQGNIIADDIADKLFVSIKSAVFRVADHLADNVAFAGNSADDLNLVDSRSTSPAATMLPSAVWTFGPVMPVLVFTSDVGFIRFISPISFGSCSSFIAARIRVHIYQAVS